MDQFYVQCHFNRIPLHPVRVKKINEWLNFSTRLVVGIQVIVFTYFRAWSITWSCGSKEKIVSLLPLTQLSVLSPPTMMESTITQKSSQLSQKCLTQALIHPNVWGFLPNRLICKHYCNFNVTFNNTKVEASVLDRRSYNHAFKVKLHSQHYSHNAGHIPKQSLMISSLQLKPYQLINTVYIIAPSFIVMMT